MFVMSYVYDLPFYKSQRGIVAHLLRGWELSGITTIQPGQSRTITQSNDPWSMVTTANATAYCSTPPCPLYPGGLGMGNSTIAIRADQSGRSSGPKSVTQF